MSCWYLNCFLQLSKSKSRIEIKQPNFCWYEKGHWHGELTCILNGWKEMGFLKQKSRNHLDMVKPAVLTAAYKQKYILHGIAEIVWITFDLLSDITRAFSVFVIYLKIITKIFKLNKGFKITVDLCEMCFATPGCVFWDCKMGQRGNSVCKWHVHQSKTFCYTKLNCWQHNQTRSNLYFKSYEWSHQYLRRGIFFIQKPRYLAWN